MTLSEISTLIYNGLIYFVLAFLIFFIGKKIYQLIHHDISLKDELVVKDNLAFTLSHLGYLSGLLIIIGGSIIGPSEGLVNDIIDILSYGLLGIILLNLSIIISDKIILRHFSIKKEVIEDKNVGVGVIEGAISIGSGLIIFGAISGEGYSLLHGIISTLIFWAIGQVVLIITTRVYNMITSYNIHKHLEEDNFAVGIGYAGALIAISIIIKFGISGVFDDWTDVVFEAGVEILIGLLLLPLMRYLTDKILLPGANLTEEIINQEKPNIGASLIEGFAYIGGAILLTWCL
ncbi:DUF350 domain-containing protein [Mesonia mobilis]|uniref:DUF350 domain-containing protein n=1 Tax=Mesonia mobilis TaxID=369791 RepID=UPI0026EF336A|nr:DUF350 domain-containing protein [Mesonia mobilis]